MKINLKTGARVRTSGKGSGHVTNTDGFQRVLDLVLPSLDVMAGYVRLSTSKRTSLL